VRDDQDDLREVERNFSQKKDVDVSFIRYIGRSKAKNAGGIAEKIKFLLLCDLKRRKENKKFL
jgi:hypothetical protein